MQNDNLNYLRQNHRHILELLQGYEKERQDSNLQIIETKQGLPTLQVQNDSRPQFIHSKYDPQKEAEKLIDQFDDEIDQYDHVLFYGVGFGYHIEEFMKRYPHFTFSIYEPNIEVFYEYTKHCAIRSLPVHRLKDVFVETSRELGQQFLFRLTHFLQERVLLIVLPTYIRIYEEKYKAFNEDFKEAVMSKRRNHFADTSFSTRWTLNSLINFPKTIETPNILDGFDPYFKDKPLIIVSAGPSLEEDYEHLRFIKEHKLAYIFAVGSANRALIAQNIMPDAVCTYDPQGHNYNVFASMIEQGITSVPMIYGTSVGFETLNWYQGPKLHMVTSQDTVAQYYLKNKDNSTINFVDDSPTIAAVAFQLAAKLGCNPIIFAGQNLAFKNNQFYSKDVDYNNKNRSIEIKEEDKLNVLLVEDVYGNLIETNPSFNNMRGNIEMYILQNPKIEVINTTKCGAAIAGTTFQPIDQLIKERFNTPVVVDNWYQLLGNNYDLAYTSERINKMERSVIDFRKLYKEAMSNFEDMQKYIKLNNENKLSKIIEKIDKLMKKIIVNKSYVCYIQPVNRTQYQALSIRTANIRKQTNVVDKVQLIIDSFQPFLVQCKQTLEQIVGSIYKVHEEAQQIIEPKSEQYKYYPSDCGAFHYEGEWEKRNYVAEESSNYPIKQHFTNKMGSVLRFRITGTLLRVYGSKRIDGSIKIQVTIDGHTETISTKTSSVLNLETPIPKQMIFEKYNLEDVEHKVEIKLLDENSFMFSGVEIENDACLLHVHEVVSVEQLEAGKRVRCHYKAKYNNVGEFSGLGEQTSEFIPPESSAFPDGDFYFIVVDENEVEGKKLIADRNVQHSISWDVLNQSYLTNYTGMKVRFRGIYKIDCGLRLITGGVSKEDIDNDWDNYIVYSDLNGTVQPGDNNIWNWIGIGSWCLDQVENSYKTVGRGQRTVTTANYNVNKNKIAIDAGLRPVLFMKNNLTNNLI